jgi:hypothetical protein
METIAHQQLKRLARQFLRSLGCVALAEEVRCPISRYRVDVAGYLDRNPRKRDGALWVTSPGLQSLYEPTGDSSRWWRCRPRTVIIECKQSRADFLKDGRDRDELLALRDDLSRFRGSIEEHRIKRIEPQLRRPGSSLFPEFDEWDFQDSRLPSYRELMRRLRRVEGQLYGQTKFHMIARYALADRLFIAAPAGMILPRELPVGWGLLECPEARLRGEPGPEDRFDEPPRLSVRTDGAEYRATEPHRLRLLRNIAVAASMALMETACRPASAREPLRPTGDAGRGGSARQTTHDGPRRT